MAEPLTGRQVVDLIGTDKHLPVALVAYDKEGNRVEVWVAGVVKRTAMDEEPDLRHRAEVIKILGA